jgi:hypothetical protein
VRFAGFELPAYRLVEQGQPLTAGVLDARCLQTRRDCHGDTMTVDDLCKPDWARIGQVLLSPFNVWRYASCLASSVQLFAAMTTGSESALATHGADARTGPCCRTGQGFREPASTAPGSIPHPAARRLRTVDVQCSAYHPNRFFNLDQLPASIHASCCISRHRNP